MQPAQVGPCPATSHRGRGFRLILCGYRREVRAWAAHQNERKRGGVGAGRTWPRPAHHQFLSTGRGKQKRPVTGNGPVKTTLRARWHDSRETGCRLTWVAHSPGKRNGWLIRRTCRDELAVESTRTRRPSVLSVWGNTSRSHCGICCSHTGIRPSHGRCLPKAVIERLGANWPERDKLAAQEAGWSEWPAAKAGLLRSGKG